MALARCEVCDDPKSRTEERYVKKVEPIGYPDTSLICGATGCENVAYVWLKEDEAEKYDKGKTVFPFQSSTSKVRVKRNLL